MAAKCSFRNDDITPKTTRQQKTISRLTRIKAPILLYSEEGVSFVIATKEGLYIPPTDIHMRLCGPYMLTNKLEAKAKQIIESGNNIKIYLEDSRSNIVDAVEMVRQFCGLDEKYYRILGYNQFFSENETNLLLMGFAKKSQGLGEGELVTWENMGHGDLGFFERHIIAN